MGKSDAYSVLKVIFIQQFVFVFCNILLASYGTYGMHNTEPALMVLYAYLGSGS